MMIYYRELSLKEGFKFANLHPESRLIDGLAVSLCSGIRLFQSLRGSPIACWKCGCQADRWIATKNRNDILGRPVLNLYGIWRPHRGKPRLVMMTRDHIIPKSLGGNDSVANLRPGCELCNGHRGAQMSPEDLAFMAANPHLISQERLQAHELRRAQAKAPA